MNPIAAPHEPTATRMHGPAQTPGAAALIQRIESLAWLAIEQDLDRDGHAIVHRLLTRRACEALAALYARDALFRSTVTMARHGFGRGEYRYFDYPLPHAIHALRTALYAHLAPIANRWNASMRIDTRFPAEHAAFVARCHAAGQLRPTPLILRYREGDYNCLHQDLYGEHVFALQATILLSQPGIDFTGGEFVITEQRPHMQSRANVVTLAQGDAVIFAVRHRPAQGTRGPYRAQLRHGVSRLHSGQRHALGILFHDAC